MTTYCITGVSGYIGRLLARRLASDPACRVVGIDVRRPARLGDIRIHEMDIRDPAIREVLAAERAETVIHLAFYTHPEGDEREARSVNIDGTRNLVEACAATRVRRFVLVSSAAVYGSHRDNPIPLTERCPVRANDDFYYSWHKAEQERVVREVLGERPDIRRVILRPAMLIGPHIDNPTGRVLRGPLLLYVKGAQPPIQLLDEDDAVEAFHLAATSHLEGVFNIAAEGTLTYPELARLMGKRIVLLPYPVLAGIATLGKWLGLSPVGAKTLRFIRHPIVLDASRFRASFGFRPRYDSRSALLRFAGAP